MKDKIIEKSSKVLEKQTKQTKNKIVKKISKKIKVLFATSEAEPFAKTGGLGDVGGSIPLALAKSGVDVSVVIPYYSSIPAEYKDKMDFIGSLNVILGWRNLYCGVNHLKHEGVNFYFIDNEYYFKRDNLYGYGDDSERTAFFSKAILESIPTIFGNTPPDVIHCNDWHTAMLPVYLREHLHSVELYKDIKVVFTVHNLKFQGIFSEQIIGDVLGLSGCEAATNQLKSGDTVNYMKGALLYSDCLTTVSPTYAEEIKNSFFGEGLEAIFRNRDNILHGILNGIDTDKHNPRKNNNIYVNYGIPTLKKKNENKLKLQEELGLNVDKDSPLIVLVSRLTPQKGIDLITHIIGELLETTNAQIAILGTGDRECENALEGIKNIYPKRVALILAFDPKLADRFYAGGDMFLMPSLFEPCGLSQMMSMAYGTLPIVRETGGLKDTVIPYNKITGEGTGFSFANYNAHELLFTLKNAIELYKTDEKAWKKLQVSAMKCEFSWKKSAKEYVEIYKNLLG